ncbi:hypothetical protein C3E94_27990, partial [Klebsiella pneumoniae]
AAQLSRQLARQVDPGAGDGRPRRWATERAAGRRSQREQAQRLGRHSSAASWRGRSTPGQVMVGLDGGQLSALLAA